MMFILSAHFHIAQDRSAKLRNVVKQNEVQKAND